MMKHFIVKPNSTSETRMWCEHICALTNNYWHLTLHLLYTKHVSVLLHTLPVGLMIAEGSAETCDKRFIYFYWTFNPWQCCVIDMPPCLEFFLFLLKPYNLLHFKRPTYGPPICIWVRRTTLFSVAVTELS